MQFMRPLLVVLSLSTLSIAMPAAAKPPAIELRLVAPSGGALEPPLLSVPADGVHAEASGSAVLVVLPPSVAKTLESATAQNRGRSLAIVIDGVVESAPVIKDTIRDGKLSITLRSAADAQRLARHLTTK
ncbi:MAG: hypothetical protein JWN44_633 [Myxococcales bacterium]|nr:hypothetical protein [Myxococcales bacterium]